MKGTVRRNLIVFIALIVLASICMALADGIQKDHGNVEIIDGKIDVLPGFGIRERYLAYKLYKPVSATAENRAPTVLLLHGY